MKIDRRRFIQGLLAIGLTTPGLKRSGNVTQDYELANIAFSNEPLTLEHHGNLCVSSRHLPEGHGSRWHAYNLICSELNNKGAILELANKVTVVRKYIARYSEEFFNDFGIDGVELRDDGYDINSIEALKIFLRSLSESQQKELSLALTAYMMDPPNEMIMGGSWEVDEYSDEMIDEADEWLWAKSLFYGGPLSGFVKLLDISLDGVGTFPGQAVSMGCTVPQANEIVQKYELPVVFIKG